MKVVPSWSIDFIFGFCETINRRDDILHAKKTYELQNLQTKDNDKAHNAKGGNDTDTCFVVFVGLCTLLIPNRCVGFP
ncbi:hypothetical protein A374_18895 [Fictibacillus macauensis ZFHKF-1]|uniref:Uncharacterized protein n=1 Tax=Fictibacillus macauensis ZFHKF-1 TaxID=1196324 RepID=I8U9X0_9BACL|nr:hypothetical protein A374_18895 [Fictibacillus macauensis ZFHKF-1]